MQKLLAFVSCLIVVCLCSVAFAFESKIINEIPDRYALLLITDVDPNQPLDKDAILALAQQEFDQLNVEQFQFAVYDKGKEMGDGIRALGEKRKNAKVEVKLFEEYSEILGKILENALGYQTSPPKIYNAILKMR